MKAENKDGWIRHRGGKCPVDAGQIVDVKFRNGTTETNKDWPRWNHTHHGRDIMSYRLHKPAEQQPETMSKIADECAELAGLANKLEQVDDQADKKAAAQNAINPLQWRDRITTIDFDIHSLTNESAELVQKLASEGLQLLDVEKPVERPVEDMSDWRNWREGDLLERISDKYTYVYTAGNVYQIIKLSDGLPHVKDNLGDGSSCLILERELKDFKFHSRPTK